MNNDFKIIKAFFYKKITFEKLKIKIPEFCNEKYFQQLIHDCIEYKSKDNLEYAFYSSCFCESAIEAPADLYADLLLENWHIMHENFASSLQDLAIYSPKIVDALFITAMKKFDYLSYNNSEALARKCIYALGAIDVKESRQILIKLSEIDDIVVRGFAIQQLKKRGYPELVPV